MSALPPESGTFVRTSLMRAKGQKQTYRPLCGHIARWLPGAVNAWTRMLTCCDQRHAEGVPDDCNLRIFFIATQNVGSRRRPANRFDCLGRPPYRPIHQARQSLVAVLLALAAHHGRHHVDGSALVFEFRA